VLGQNHQGIVNRVDRVIHMTVLDIIAAFGEGMHPFVRNALNFEQKSCYLGYNDNQTVTRLLDETNLLHPYSPTVSYPWVSKCAIFHQSVSVTLRQHRRTYLMQLQALS
jgi:hypothetical protein